MPRYSRSARALTAVPAAGLAMLLLAACGGGGAATAEPAANSGAVADNGDGITSGGTTAAPGAGTPGTGTAAQGRGAGGGRQMPGASGKIAEVSDSTMQVQSTSTQTAVSWTEDTTFTDTVSAKSSDLAVGKCISVTPAATDATTAATDTTPVAAASISITDAVNGACGIGGFGGGGFGGGMRGGGQLPTGQARTDGQAPTGGQRPDGARPGGGFRGGANGKVVSVDGDTIVVESARPQPPAQGSAGSAATTPTTTTTSRTVSFSSATTWTRTVSADSDALKVGRCVTALGTAGTTGAVSATSVVVRPATNGECTGGFGGRGQSTPAGS